MDELNQVINKLPRGKCADSAGYIREIFVSVGKNFRRSVLDVTNKIKQFQAPPTAWSKMSRETMSRSKTGAGPGLYGTFFTSEKNKNQPKTGAKFIFKNRLDGGKF